MIIKRLPLLLGKQECERYHGLLIDVREEDEFKTFHLEGALHIPLLKFEHFLSQIKDKSTPLYLYCRSGRRSEDAAKLAYQKHFTQVINIGGIIELEK
jgi:phage shock protein E